MSASLLVNQKVGRKVSFKFWQNLLNRAVLVSKLKGKYSISLAVVGTAEAKKFNYIYRGKNKPTNVLSFAEIDVKNTKFVQSGDGYLGEVIICYPLAVRQAKVLNIDLNKHLSHLFVHGFLHLLGYDHQSDKQALEMEKVEDKILNN